MSKVFNRKLWRRCIAVFMCAAAALSVTCRVKAAEPAELSAPRESAGQAEDPAARSTKSSPAVYINGLEYTGNSFLYNSTTYVGIREYSMFMGAAGVDWNSAEKTAVVKSDELTVSAKSGSNYVIANGRYLWAKDGIMIKDGTMYVPIRVIAKAFGCSVEWEQSTRTVYVSGGGGLLSGSEYYRSDEVLWLSRIINAEAGNEPLNGKIAVGTVVLNRVASSQFPDTIYGVIFDTNCGIQFTPAANGTIYNEPNAESVIAAKLCLDGASVSDKVLFFMNGRIAQSTWISDNRPYVMTIGNHDFFA